MLIEGACEVRTKNTIQILCWLGVRPVYYVVTLDCGTCLTIIFSD